LFPTFGTISCCLCRLSHCFFVYYGFMFWSKYICQWELLFKILFKIFFDPNFYCPVGTIFIIKNDKIWMMSCVLLYTPHHFFLWSCFVFAFWLMCRFINTFLRAFCVNNSMQRIQYAKTKSDCIAKEEGSYVPREKKKKQEEKGDHNWHLLFASSFVEL